ncbi:MAG: RecB-family nuclease [Desulfurococcales archaeon]|nr:RecB-family nuclease [Desulfurococcales archaeon]
MSSVQKLVDMARLVYSMGFKVLVATRVYGAAAQSGVPEATRIALKHGGSLLVLQDIDDAIDLLKPRSVYIVTSDYAERKVNPEEFNPDDGSLLAFNGGEPDFTLEEARKGQPIYLAGLEQRIGPIAEASILLYSVKRRTERRHAEGGER